MTPHNNPREQDVEFGALLYQRVIGRGAAIVMLIGCILLYPVYRVMSDIDAKTPGGVSAYLWVALLLTPLILAFAARRVSIVRFYEKGVVQRGLTNARVAYRNAALLHFTVGTSYSTAHNGDIPNILRFRLEADYRYSGNRVRFETTSLTPVPSALDLVPAKHVDEPLFKIVDYIRERVPETTRIEAA
jgi:hypothetical protein